MTISAILQSAMNTLGTSIPELACQLRYAGEDETLNGTIATAITAGIDRTRVITEQGTVDAVIGAIRYDVTLEPASWSIPTDGQVPAISGQPIEVEFHDSATWRRLRVVNRKVFGNMVRLNLASEFEET